MKSKVQDPWDPSSHHAVTLRERKDFVFPAHTVATAGRGIIKNMFVELSPFLSLRSQASETGKRQKRQRAQPHNHCQLPLCKPQGKLRTDTKL